MATKRKSPRLSKHEAAMEELDIAGMMMGITGPTNPKTMKEVAKALKMAEAAGIARSKALKHLEEAAETGEDLAVTIGSLGSLTFGGFTIAPTELGRKRAKPEWDRVHRKYTKKRTSKRK